MSCGDVSNKFSKYLHFPSIPCTQLYKSREVSNTRYKIKLHLGIGAVREPDTLIDCVISSSLRQDTLSRYEAGTVGRLAHERKVQQVGGAVNRLNMEFLPFSLESLGTLTQTAINIVTKLGRDRAIRNGGDQDKSVNNAFKQISVTLQKCNSDMFLNKYYSLESYNIM